MMLKKWEDLPLYLQIDEIRPYYNYLRNKRLSLFIKRIFDIVVSFVIIIILLPLFIFISVLIRIDSKGPAFYRQERITQYGKIFRIYKFRTMIQGSDKGNLITSSNDNRITRLGKFLRKSKIDEIPQLFNVLIGDMTFVGTRPEVLKYVEEYTNEMKSTLLLPAGITSLASIYFSDENELINSRSNVDDVYINEIMPIKMEWNLKEITRFSLINDIKIMFITVFTVFRNNIKI